MKTTSKGSSHTFSKLSLQGTTRNVNISVKRHICYLDLPYPWMPETSFPSLMFQCPKWISLERPLNPVVHQNSPPKKSAILPGIPNIVAYIPSISAMFPFINHYIPTYISMYVVYIYTHIYICLHIINIYIYINRYIY